MRTALRAFALGLGLAALAAGPNLSLASSIAEDGDTGTSSTASRPGGATTYSGPLSRDAFSKPAGNLSFEAKLDFRIGKALFRRPWVSAPASTSSNDGLGPLHNARACIQCHQRDGRGHPPAAPWPGDTAVSMLLRLSVPPRTPAERAALASGRLAVIPDPHLGGQLQDFALRTIPAEGRLRIDYAEQTVVLADGATRRLRRPAVSIVEPAHGPLDPELMISARVAPPMIGLGLLEAIPEAAVLANADPDDRDGDGISGRANRVWDAAARRLALGRFGWKAGQPDIRQQSAAAFSGDLGLSTRLYPEPWGDCMPTQVACREAPHGDDGPDMPEIADAMLDLVVFYARTLAVPARREAAHPQVRQGERLFHAAGCAGCHVPTFRTAADAEPRALAGQVIHPYTDLLLHDMGEGLADGRPEAAADGREWRTPPLWGIGLTERVSGHTFFLHDGRARNLQEAILWHGGEAAAARDRFAGFSAEERAALLRFVGSL